MKKKPGVKGKSKEIDDNFNKKKLDASKEDELEARRQALLDGTAEPDVAGDPDFQMLADMRFVYRKIGGRQKLLELVEGSDKEFAKLCKDLLSLETALMTAKMRKPEDPAKGNTVFVILKGLEAESVEMKTVEGLDMKQITDAIDPSKLSNPELN
jgi:hypothetical protein